MGELLRRAGRPGVFVVLGAAALAWAAGCNSGGRLVAVHDDDGGAADPGDGGRPGTGLDVDAGAWWGDAGLELLGVTGNVLAPGGSELRRLDPLTGRTSQISSLPDVSALLLGGNTEYRDAGRLVFISLSPGEPGERLVSVASMSGIVEQMPFLLFPDGGFQSWSGWEGLHPRSDGQLVAVQSVDAFRVGLISISPSTGVSRFLSSWADGGRVMIPRAYDTRRDLLYAWESTSDTGSPVLYGVDAQSGQHLPGHVLRTGDGGRETWPSILSCRSDGSLLAVLMDADGRWWLKAVDPTTGMTLLLVQQPLLSLLTQNGYFGPIFETDTYDDSRDVLCFIAAAAPGIILQPASSSLVCVDGMTGALLANAPIDGAAFDGGPSPYDWSGGLHFVDR